MRIDANGQITTAERLDREDPSHRDLVATVAARDAGGHVSYASVRVSLLDDNDNAPRFCAAEYRASVKSSVAEGFLVAQVQAHDPDDGPNARITYSVYSDSHVPVADLLEIDPDSGWIVTKGAFGHLVNSVLYFFVKAEDGGHPARHSLVSVYVHVISPAAFDPSFLQHHYEFSVPEDTPVGAAVGMVRLKAPRGYASFPAVFSLINGAMERYNQDGVFVVEKDTGLLKLNKALDHERIKGYYFKVAATIQQTKIDSVASVDVEVKVLDLNDNKPEFVTKTYEATVTEGAPLSTKLLQVRALDSDSGVNGQVRYSLGGFVRSQSDSQTLLETFGIDSKSGWISTLKELDHETSSSYVFTVVAADFGETASFSATATVTVAVTDVNDNPPRFLERHYFGSVQESSPPGEVVAALDTRDDDSSALNRQVSYHITGEQQRKQIYLKK